MAEALSRRLIPAFLLVVLTTAAGTSPAIVGGNPAEPGEYPWMAMTYRFDPTGPIPIVLGPACGGALVAPRFVVSAHHCILDLIDPTLSSLPADPLALGLHVFLGANRRSDRGGERIRVKAFHQAPDPPFGAVLDGDTDILLLELYEASAQPTLPWAGPEDADLYPPGSSATIIGWGLMEEAPLALPGAILAGALGGVPDALQEADLPIVSDAACRTVYQPNFVGRTMVCAGFGEGGVDTCQGDSGGPLLTTDELGDYLLIGTTWFGNGCGRPGSPGVYAEVAPFSDFIASVVG